MRVSILGPGLLGGSLALAVKKYLPGAHVSLWARREDSLHQARTRRAADAYSLCIKEAVRDANIIVLATPVGVMPSLAEQLLEAVSPLTIVTDVGSVKSLVHRQVGALFSQKQLIFIGSHPMAGSEKQGMEAASETLFNHATVVLTNDEKAPAEQVERLRAFWEAVGAECVELSAELHDNCVARVSHFPHALAGACSLAAVTQELPFETLKRLAARGYKDTSRVAEGDPAMWTEILLENADAVKLCLDDAIKHLQNLKNYLNHADAQQVNAWLTQARQSRLDML